MLKKKRRQLLERAILLSALVWTTSGLAEDSAPRSEPTVDSRDSVRELRDQVRELQAAVAGMRAETAELRRDLNEMRAGKVHANEPRMVSLSDAGARTNMVVQSADPQDEQQNQKKSEHAASLEEEYQLLSGKVDDQYQTKVESASKYRLRMSGIVLMNLVSNQGVVDSVDLPTLAYARPAGYSGGSFGATLRQSQIGFEAFGPNVAGAKTRADLQLDLAGGFPSVPNGINSGLVRLRTGTMRMDWTNTSVVVGQDAIFFSPNSPTSFASLAIPALSYAGNLWGWVPQIRVEHKVALSENSNLMFQAGILDPLSGEVPGAADTLTGGRVTAYNRQAGPGEASRQPAYATRMAWTTNVFGQPLRVGVAGYYSRQDYGFDRTVDGWAGMTDIDLPLSHRLSLSAEFYRGRALGGLYGGIGRSVLFSGDPTLPSTELQALNSVGGWTQVKYRPASKWELNAAFGMDNPYASDLEYFQYAQSYGDPTLA